MQWKLAKKLADNLPTETVVLQAGDFLIPKQDDTNILIERMTILDFLGKIQSKRLDQQIYKMKQVTQHYIIIIENLFLLKKTKWNPVSVHKMIAGYFEHNKVLLAPTSDWTFDYIMYYYNKYGTDRSVRLNETRAKPKSMSLIEQAIFSLSGIDGVGSATAKKLLGTYGTIADLCKLKKDEYNGCCSPKLASHIYNVLHTEL